MSRNRNLWLKSWTLGAAIGLVAGIATYLVVTSLDNTFVQVVLYGVSLPFALLVYVANWGLIGVEELVDIGTIRQAKDWPALLQSATVAPVAVGLSIAGYTAVLLRVPPWSLVDRLWPEPPMILDRQLEKATAEVWDPLRAESKLIGRGEEKSVLRRFAGTAAGDGPLWTLLYAPHSFGKTRLSLEWLRILRDTGWDTGFLRTGVGIDDVREVRVRRKTAIVIDEASRQVSGGLWDIVDELLQRDRQVRILLVDQNPMVPLPRDLQGPARQRLEQTFWREAGVNGIKLALLDDTELHEIAPTASAETIERAEGRPLYVLLGPDPAATIAAKVEDRLGPARHSPAELRLLAFAALASPVRNEVWKRLLGDNVDLTRRQAIFGGPTDEERQELRRILPQLHPEPFADELFLTWAHDSDDDDREALLKAGLEANPEAVDARLQSFWTDRRRRPEDVALIRDLQAVYDRLAPERVATLRAEAAEAYYKMADALSSTATPTQDATWESWAAKLTSIADRRPEDREIRLRDSTAAVSVIHHYGDHRRFDDLERWADRLDDLAQRLPDDREIRLCEATATAEVIYYYGDDKWFDDLEHLADRLDDLAQRFPDDQEIRLQETMATVNAIESYGDDKRFDDLERWADRLDDIAQRFMDDREIRMREAMAAVNVIYDYGDDKQFDNLERWADRLDDIAQRFMDDREIRLQEARAAVNAFKNYGDDKRFYDLERWAGRLDDLAQHFPDDQEIRLQEAKAAVNAIGHYGTEKRFYDLERWAGRLNNIAQSFPGDQEIRLQEAKAAVNAITAYGTDKRFDDLEHWADRLDDIVRRFPAEREIRLQEATAAVNAMRDYGGDKRFYDLERWNGRFDELVRRFPDDREIQLRKVKAVTNAIGYYGADERFGDLKRWVDRLDDLAQCFLEDQEFRVQEAMALFNAIVSYRGVTSPQQQQRSQWFVRLRGLALAFPHSPEIQEIATTSGIDRLS